MHTSLLVYTLTAIYIYPPLYVATPSILRTLLSYYKYYPFPIDKEAEAKSGRFEKGSVPPPIIYNLIPHPLGQQVAVRTVEPPKQQH